MFWLHIASVGHGFLPIFICIDAPEAGILMNQQPHLQTFPELTHTAL